MRIEANVDTDLIVQSFDYLARQLAGTPDAVGAYAQYEEILSEAEKHRSALRLVQRDVLQTAEQRLRAQAMTKEEVQRLRETTARTIAQAQQAITNIAAQYVPHKMAA